MNQIAVKAESPLIKLHDQMEVRTQQFSAALPAHIPVERFKRVLLTAVQNNPTLAGADRQTFFNSAMRAAQDGLLPDGREGAMVIYKTKKKDGNREFWIEAVQWMPMIGGIRKKVRNSGEIETWDAHCVHEKDAFDFELGDDPFIKHKPFMGGDRGKIVAAYSVAVLKSGEKSREVMSVEEIRDVWRKSSKQKDKDGNPTGPWKDHFGEMCRKTVARRHSKVLPMSTGLDDLIRRDDELYDIGGASDRNVTPGAERPKLADFADAPQRPVTEKPTEIVDADTGEIVEEQQAEADTAAEGFSAADAFELGREARKAGKALRAVPPEWRDNPAFEAFASAWQDGWREADGEAAK